MYIAELRLLAIVVRRFVSTSISKSILVSMKFKLLTVYEFILFPRRNNGISFIYSTEYIFCFGCLDVSIFPWCDLIRYLNHGDNCHIASLLTHLPQDKMAAILAKDNFKCIFLNKND